MFSLTTDLSCILVADMTEGFFMTKNTTAMKNYSKLTDCERPIPKGSKPFLPCLLVTFGSGTIIAKVMCALLTAEINCNPLIIKVNCDPLISKVNLLLYILM